MSQNKPLVTIAMMTYNQEKYVRDAVHGVLAQTYEPLEIIISDDCSTDRTWEIITEEVGKYRAIVGVYKKIVLNRNEGNLGIGQNFFKMMSLSHGEIIIAAAGDDISLPERVSRIVEAWVKDGRRAKIISHRALMIDKIGRLLGPSRRVSAVDMLGACQAWTIDCWKMFDNTIREGESFFEDHIFSARAQLLGGDDEGLVIEDVLVYYRVGSGITTMQNLISKRNYKANCMRQKSKRRAIWDIEHVKASVPIERKNELIGKLKESIFKTEMQNKLLSGRSFSERYKAYKFVNVKGVNVFNLLYLISPVLGDFFSNLCVMLKRFWLRLKYGERVVAN